MHLTYPVAIEPLPNEQGGGFLARVPDLAGCISDGAAPEEAVCNVQDAIGIWIEAARDMRHPIPLPSRQRVVAAA